MYLARLSVRRLGIRRLFGGRAGRCGCCRRGGSGWHGDGPISGGRLVPCLRRHRAAHGLDVSLGDVIQERMAWLRRRKRRLQEDWGGLIRCGCTCPCRRLRDGFRRGRRWCDGVTLGGVGLQGGPAVRRGGSPGCLLDHVKGRRMGHKSASFADWRDALRRRWGHRQADRAAFLGNSYDKCSWDMRQIKNIGAARI